MTSMRKRTLSFPGILPGGIQAWAKSYINTDESGMLTRDIKAKDVLVRLLSAVSVVERFVQIERRLTKKVGQKIAEEKIIFFLDRASWICAIKNSQIRKARPSELIEDILGNV